MGKSRRSRSANRNENNTINVENETLTLPNGITQELLDIELMRTMLTDVKRNSITGDVGYLEGNPKGRLYRLYESPTSPWNTVFKSFSQFEKYYEKNVEPQMLKERQKMMDYLKEHPSEDTVTRYGWMNGAYNE